MTPSPDRDRRRRIRAAERRFWLAEHGAALGLGVALLLLVLIVAPGLYYFVLPTGPSEQVEGVITALGYAQRDTSSDRRAVVRLADRTVSVSVRRSPHCAVGSAVSLDRRPTRSGARYAARSCGAPQAPPGSAARAAMRPG